VTPRRGKLPPSRLLAFGAIGALNTLLSWLLYLALLAAGLGLAAAYTLSFVAGIALSGLLTMRPVFGTRSTSGAWRSYVTAYLAAWAAGLALVSLIARLGAPDALAPLLALPLTVPLTYLILRRALRDHARA
jgi:putative flippase GtrA